MAEKLKIIGSLTSPFVRIVRVVCEELHAPYEVDVVLPFGKMSEEQNRRINENNPLMKVPILIDKGQNVLDSRVIVTYLLKHYAANKTPDFSTEFPKTPQEDNIVSTIYGIADSGVLGFMTKNTHPEVNMDHGFMKRSNDRLEHGLAWLDKQQSLGQDFGVPEALLICVLEWFTKRNICDWQKYPHLESVHSRFQNRPSLVKTRIPKEL